MNQNGNGPQAPDNDKDLAQFRNSGQGSLTPGGRRAGKRLYLEALETFGNIGRAAKSIGISAQSIRNWRRQDSVFAEQEREAMNRYGRSAD